MYKIIISISMLLGLVTNAIAVDCSSISNAIELETICKPGATTTCNIDSAKVYKISKSTSSKANSLPPIHVKAGGALCIANESLAGNPVTLYAQSIWVDGGLFQIGSSTDPISSNNKLTIVMTGNKSVAMAPKPLCADPSSGISCSNIAKTSKDSSNARDITVTNGGKLLMYGNKGLTKNINGSYIHNVLGGSTFKDCFSTGCKTDSGIATNDLSLDPYFNNLVGSNSWTYLAMPAGDSFYSRANWVQAPVDYSNLEVYTDNKLTNKSSFPSKLTDYQYMLALSKDVTSNADTGWQKGDWISISTTSFSSHQTEIVQICDIYYTKNLEVDAKVFPSLLNDPFYKGSTPNKSQYTSELQLSQPVTVIRLAGNGCAIGQFTTSDVGTPLKNYHFGGLMPTPGYFSSATASYTNSDLTKFKNIQKGQAYSFYDGSLRNYGIDERAEVALLSKNIKLTSTAGDGGFSPATYPESQYFGGHIAIMHSKDDAPNEQVELVGIEIEKFGQSLVGRYPVHFHRLNSQSAQEDANLLVQDTSVHHSYNKCFVPHATKGIKFYNNVCVRAIGQGFYLEDGYRVEDNQFIRNLIAGMMGASLNSMPYNPKIKFMLPKGFGYNLFWSGDYMTNNDAFIDGGYDPSEIPDTSNSGANTGHPIDSLNPNGFWITNFGDDQTPNLFINNSVAGCQIQGRGYWLIKQALKSKYGTTFPKQTAYPVFQGNRAHGCYAGLDTDARMDLGVSNKTTSAPYPVAPTKAITDQALAPAIIFNDLTFTRIRYKAFWTRSLFTILLNSRFAANKQGITILGGGGPEGNLLGFWGLVKDNVIAGISNNNVERYYDCNNYMSTQGTQMQGLGVEVYNEASECVAFIAPPLTGEDAAIYKGLKQQNTLNAIVGEGSVVNWNIQGYTFYDGPARMENSRFINFRADATDSINIDNNQTRYLSTRVDARKMLDLNNNINQFGILLDALLGLKGGAKHNGYVGDPALAWIKGNSQSLPPTQYTFSNIWENTDYKHQVFTETVNMNAGISDGDKQTIILDKDATIANYNVCGINGCNEAINHFPISLNNLTFYGTPYTVDEPDAIGRNNIIASAMMSPHKYATMNIETSPNQMVAAAPKYGNLGNSNFNLKIIRDMDVYNGKVSDILLYGRGGQPIFETFFMNNMGYTVYPQKNAKQSKFDSKLLLSYSDAPTDGLFINRIGICLGTDVAPDTISVGRLLRQWGMKVTYLGISPYIASMKNKTNCSAIFKGADTWGNCNNNATQLSSVDSGKSIVAINNEFVALSKLKPTDTVSQKFYFNQSTGILYFNMIQLGDDQSNIKPITPPYVLCDSKTYTDAFSDLKKYKMFSNKDSINASLQTSCFYPKDLAKKQEPQNSDLINCPREGCVSYTIDFTGGNGQCGQPSVTAKIIPPSPIKTNITKVTVNGSNQLAYASPYWLKNTINEKTVIPQLGEAEVTGYYDGSSNGDKNFYFNCDQAISKPISSIGLLPLATLNCGTNNPIKLGPLKGGKPTNLTAWTLATGGGTIAVIKGPHFAGPPPIYTPKLSYTVQREDSSGLFFISGAYPHTVTIDITISKVISKVTYSCDKIILNAGGDKPAGGGVISGGTVETKGCSKSFLKHLQVKKGPKNSGAPTTFVAQP